MKRLLIISLVLTFVLFGCRIANKQDYSETPGPSADEPSERVFWGKDLRPITVPMPASTERSVLPERQASPARRVSIKGTESLQSSVVVRPELIALGTAGSYTVSIVYPSVEYGVIRVDKTMPKEVPLNRPFNYSINITNLIDVTLTDVIIAETLPKGFSFTGAAPIPERNADSLVWLLARLEPRTSQQITVSGMAIDTYGLEYCTTITHVARACANIEVVQPRLEILKVTPLEVLLCDSIPVEFVVTNAGTGLAQNVKIVDALPTGLRTVDGKSTLVLDAGNLTAGQSRKLTAELRATQIGTYISKATASSASGLKAESPSATITVRQPVLEIVKIGPDLLYLGRSLSYEILVTNKGNGLAKDTVVEDSIPLGVTSVEATAGAEFSGQKLIWRLGTLAPGESKNVRVSFLPTQVGELTSNAIASAYCAGSVAAYSRTSIAGIPAVRLEVVDLQDPIEVGGETTYLIAVTNQGSAPDTNIRIVCTLEEKIQYVSSTGATVGSMMGRTVSFAPLRSLEPMAKATWRVVVRGVRPGGVRFKVTMNTDQLVRPVEETEATHLYK